jgi:hypothetical protein
VSSFYANAVCALPEQRAEHPYRVEVLAVEQIVREMQKQFLAHDPAYLDSFEPNRVLENVRARRLRTRRTSTLDLSTIEQADRELGQLHTPERTFLRLNKNGTFVKRPSEPPAAPAAPPAAKRGAASAAARPGGAGAERAADGAPAARSDARGTSRQMSDKAPRSTFGGRPTIVARGAAK